MFTVTDGHFVTFCMSRRRHEMYIDHGWLSVPRRIPTLQHGPGFYLGNGRGAPRLCTVGQSAISARVSLLWQQHKHKVSASALYSLYAWLWKAVHIPVHLTWYVHGIILFHVADVSVVWSFLESLRMLVLFLVFIKLLCQWITHFSHDTIFVTNPVVFMLSDLISYWWHA